jgi:hypothetical protein
LYSASRLQLFPICEEDSSSEFESSFPSINYRCTPSSSSEIDMEPATGSDSITSNSCIGGISTSRAVPELAGGLRLDAEPHLPSIDVTVVSAGTKLHPFISTGKPCSQVQEDYSDLSLNSATSDEIKQEKLETLQSHLLFFEIGDVSWGTDAKVGPEDNDSAESDSLSFSRPVSRSFSWSNEGSARSVGEVSLDASAKRAKEKVSMLSKLKLLLIPVCFLLFYVLCWGALMFQVVYSATMRDEWHHSFVAWSQCAVGHYRGTDESWHSICGAHPPLRMSVDMKASFNVFFAGQGIFISLIFLPTLLSFLMQQYKQLLGYEALNSVSEVNV